MDVKHVAKLANLDLTEAQLAELGTDLDSVMKLVDDIQQLDTTDVAETAQVTDQVNVTRIDEIDTSRILTQEAALSNAHDSHNGFFRVKAIFSQE